MALFSFLGESRIAMIGGEGDSILLGQMNPEEALLVDSFGKLSTLDATFKVPSEWLPQIRAGLNPRSRDWPDRRAYWLSFRGKHNEIRNFPIIGHVEEDAKDGIVTLKVQAADARQWLDNVPGLKSGIVEEVNDTISNLLVRITQRVSSLDDSVVQGKNDQFLLPATVFDPNWEPTAEQAAQGFISWKSFEDGTVFKIKDTGPQPVREMLDDVLNEMEFHHAQRFELWPLEEPGTDGSQSPWFRWVLRTRVQTSVVLSEYSGTYSLDSVTGDLTNADTQLYRSDDRTKYSFSSGTHEVATEWLGPWARMKFESVTVDDVLPKSLVPRPSLPARVAFSGKGGVGYKIEPGSLGFVRNGSDVVPITLDAISTHYGSNDWSLGSVYSEMLHYDVIATEGPTAESIVIKVGGSTTYSIPFQQAPLPQGGATYSVWEGGTLLAQATFNNNPSSSAFVNVLQVSIGDTFDHTLRIQVDGDDSYGRHTFGRANCFDGSLYDAADSVFRYLKEVIELPLQGYFREVAHTQGAGHAHYSARQFQGCPLLVSIPITENWGGYNEAAFVQNLWGFIPLTGSEASKLYLGVMESQFEACVLLQTLPVEAHWPVLKKLATGYRNRQFFGANSPNMGVYTRFAEMPSVTNIVALGSVATLGYRRSQFEASRANGILTFTILMDALTGLPDYFLERTFYGASFISSLNVILSVGSNTIAGSYVGSELAYNARTVNVSFQVLGTISEVSGAYFLQRLGSGNYASTAASTLVTVTLPGLRTVSGNYFLNNLYGGGNSNLAPAHEQVVIPEFSQLETISGTYFMQFVAGNTKALDIKLPEFPSLKTVSGTYFMRAALVSIRGYTDWVIPHWNSITTISGSNFMSGFANSDTTSPASSGVSSVRLPDLSGLVTVGTNFMFQSFYYCTQITTLNFPFWSSITSIGVGFCEGVFGRAQSVQRVLALPDLFGLNVVPGRFFYNGIDGIFGTVIMPNWNSFTSVGEFFCAIWGLQSVTTLVLPTLTSCITVGDNFLYSMLTPSVTSRPQTMETFTFPNWDSFTTVGEYFLRSFMGYASVTREVNFPRMLSLTAAGGGFLNGFFASHTSVITHLQFPAWSSLTSLGHQAFSVMARGVAQLTLPSLANVTTIGSTFMADFFAAAIYTSASTLTTITIPVWASVSSIGSNPFIDAFGVQSLKNVVFPPATFPLIAAAPGGWFCRTFAGSGLESITFPEWSQFTSLLNSNTNGFMNGTLRECALLRNVVLPTLPNVTSGAVNYFMTYLFFGSGLINGAQLVEKTWPSAVGIGTGYMMGFFQNCVSLQTLPIQRLTGKTGVSYTSYRESYARNCPALLADQAVWDKPTFSVTPTHATIERCRQWSAGGSTGSVHKWFDGSGAVVPPADGTNAIGVPSNFFTA